MKHIIIMNGKEYKINISTINYKMGKIPSFSINKGVYCSRNCKACYVDKTTNLRKKMIPCLNENTEFIKDLTLFNMYSYASVFAKLVKQHNCKVFRFNVSGEINEFYLKFILQVCKLVQDTKFYFYTKSYRIISRYIDDIKNTNNLIVNISIMNYCESYLLYDNDLLTTDNIKFFVTVRNNEEKEQYKHNYNNIVHSINNTFGLSVHCLNDLNKDKCVHCGLCFEQSFKVVFNSYRDLKTIKPNVYIQGFKEVTEQAKKLSSNNYIVKSFLDAALICLYYLDIKTSDIKIDILPFNKVKFTYNKSRINNIINGILYVNQYTTRYLLTRFFITYIVSSIYLDVYNKRYKDVLNAYEIITDNSIFNFDTVAEKLVSDRVQRVNYHKEKDNENKFIDVVYNIVDEVNKLYEDRACKSMVKNRIQVLACYKHLKKEGLVNVDRVLKDILNQEYDY